MVASARWADDLTDDARCPCIPPYWVKSVRKPRRIERSLRCGPGGRAASQSAPTRRPANYRGSSDTRLVIAPWPAAEPRPGVKLHASDRCRMSVRNLLASLG